MKDRALTKTMSFALPLLGAFSIVLIWWVALPLFGVPAFVVPSPLAVASKFFGEWRFLLSNAAPTILESVLGFLFGNLAAIDLWSGEAEFFFKGLFEDADVAVFAEN